MYAYPYASNPHWKDVTPVPEQEFIPSVVKIATTPKFDETMGYYRAIVKANEMSERALSITHDVIKLNPANYTAWQYRIKCLVELKADMREELAFAVELSEDNPKCYQVWQHRRAVVSVLGSPENELAATAAYLREDTKNYHTWSYRQWLLRTFGGASAWAQDLRDTAGLLVALDVRNNSLWNQRSFLLTRCFPAALASPSVVRAELAFVFFCIHRVSLSESAWVYLDSLVRAPGFRHWSLVARLALTASVHVPLSARVHARLAAQTPFPGAGAPPCNRFAHATLLELLLDPRCPPLDLAALAADSPATAALEGSLPGAGFGGRDDFALDATADAVLAAEAAGWPADVGPAPAVPASGLAAIALLSRALEQCESLVVGDGVRARYWAYRRAQVAAAAQAERDAYAAPAPGDAAEAAAAFAAAEAGAAAAPAAAAVDEGTSASEGGSDGDMTAPSSDGDE
jgi:protein farnesyltransferase/geranylgeranyltransferase type-1 subunit alpha